MNFKMFTVLHHMELNTVKSKGKRIEFKKHKGRITNSIKEFEKALSHQFIYEYIGEHSISEFQDSTYIYISGQLDEQLDFEDVDKIGVGLTFELLREIELYLHNLWAVKDHNVYVRDGFLVVNSSKSSGIGTYKAALTAINSKANYTKEDFSMFTDDELDQAQKYLNEDLLVPSEDDHDTEIHESRKELMYKYPSQYIFHKTEGSTRFSRAVSFVILARSSSVLPLKIVSYVNAIECLLTTSKAELSYRLSQRVAFLLESTLEERMKLSKTMRNAYNLRSTIVHGEHIKSSLEEMLRISDELDRVIRLLIVDHGILFKESTDNQIDEEFEKLIFK